MTKKDFFRIIIKLFGLNWLIVNIYSLSQLFYFTNAIHGDYSGILFSLGALFLSIIIFVFLVLKTDIIIRWLKLDRNFDEERIEVNLSVEKLLVLAIIIIGGSMMIDNFAPFLSQIYLFFKVMVSNQNDLVNLQGQSTYMLIVHFTKIILGYFLLTNYPTVSRFLLKITQQKEE